MSKFNGRVNCVSRERRIIFDDFFTFIFEYINTYSIRSLVRCWKSDSKITVMLLPCRSLDSEPKKEEDTN